MVIQIHFQSATRDQSTVYSLFSDSILWYDKVVNHVPPPHWQAHWWAARLVAARPVGVFKANGPLHPPASALPPYSQERPTFLRSTRYASGHRGDFSCVERVFSPRDVDCGRATTASNRLSVTHKVQLGTFSPFLFSRNCNFSHCVHWQLRGQ